MWPAKPEYNYRFAFFRRKSGTSGDRGLVAIFWTNNALQSHLTLFTTPSPAQANVRSPVLLSSDTVWESARHIVKIFLQSCTPCETKEEQTYIYIYIYIYICISMFNTFKGQLNRWPMSLISKHITLLSMCITLMNMAITLISGAMWRSLSTVQVTATTVAATARGEFSSATDPHPMMCRDTISRSAHPSLRFQTLDGLEKRLVHNIASAHQRSPNMHTRSLQEGTQASAQNWGQET